MPTLYFLVRKFNENTGSYAGFVEKFSKFAHAKGYEVQILCGLTSKDEVPVEKLSYATVRRFSIPRTYIPLLGMTAEYLVLAHKVKKYLKKNPPGSNDLFVANGRVALGILDRSYTLRIGQPAMTFLRNMEIAKTEVSLITRIARKIHFSIIYLLEKKYVSAAKSYLTSTYASMKNVSQYYETGDKSFIVPHGGVDFSHLKAGKKLSFKGKNMLFIAAGKEKVRKGVVYLEKALPTLFRTHPDLHLIHVGEKFHWDIPRKYQDRIRSVGRVPWDRMKDYYASADLMVNCALNEWIPHIIFEAMYCRCPIVTSDIDGIHEVIDHKEQAYIYRRGDVKGLVEGVEYMLKNPAHAKRMAKDAHKKVKNISYEKYGDVLLDFLQRAHTQRLYVDVLNSCRKP